MDLKQLFAAHLEERLAWAGKGMAETGYDALVISSGQPYTHFSDDQDAPFRSVPHFLHHCPLRGPHHVLKLVPGRKPLLIRYAPEDFWYEQMPLEALWGGTPFWLDGFELVECPSLDAVWETLGKPGRAAYIGNETERATAAGLDVNPAAITAWLDWGRSYKSEYEVVTTVEATRLGAKGHSAGREAFRAGASELEIHHAFAQAVGCLDHDLAFASIVALNEKGATLHYEGKRTGRNGKVLLLDCGANVRGYASDITRTTPAAGCDGGFTALVAGMEKLQQELCAEVRAGMPFGDLHHSSHLKIGALLQDSGIVSAGPEEAIAKGFTRVFYPHGLGHHLGLQVHDVAGKLASPKGELQPPPPEHPYLRTTRPIEERHLFTVEPGLYFIPMLQRPFRDGEHASRFNWKLIDELGKCGGIRIEDNIFVTSKGPRNLTREHLPN